MTTYRFRIVGVPPEEAIKEIDIRDDATVEEVKKIIPGEDGASHHKLDEKINDFKKLIREEDEEIEEDERY